MQKMLTKRLFTIIMRLIMVITMLNSIPVTTILAADGSQSTIYYIQNNYKTNCYLYDDNGTLSFGQPLSNIDLRYQWSVEDIGGVKAIKNAATGNYINVKNCVLDWNGTVNVSSFEEGNSDFLWSFDTTTTTNLISVSVSQNNINIQTSVDIPAFTTAQCRNVDTSWGTTKWDFIKSTDFTAPVIETAYYIQNDYKTSSYLYENNGILQFGQPLTNTDLRYQWYVEEKDGNKAIKNAATGNYINIKDSVSDWNGTVNVSTFKEGNND